MTNTKCGIPCWDCNGHVDAFMEAYFNEPDLSKSRFLVILLGACSIRHQYPWYELPWALYRVCDHPGAACSRSLLRKCHEQMVVACTFCCSTLQRDLDWQCCHQSCSSDRHHCHNRRWFSFDSFLFLFVRVSILVRVYLLLGGTKAQKDIPYFFCFVWWFFSFSGGPRSRLARDPSSLKFAEQRHVPDYVHHSMRPVMSVLLSLSIMNHLLLQLDRRSQRRRGVSSRLGDWASDFLGFA